MEGTSPPDTNSQAHRRRTWGMLLALAALALALRVLYLTYVSQVPILYDAEAYLKAGDSLAAGRWSEASNCIGRAGPGYPLLLAAVFSVLPTDPWSVRYLQAALGT